MLKDNCRFDACGKLINFYELDKKYNHRAQVNRLYNKVKATNDPVKLQLLLEKISSNLPDWKCPD